MLQPMVPGPGYSIDGPFLIFSPSKWQNVLLSAINECGMWTLDLQNAHCFRCVINVCTVACRLAIM